MRPTDSRRIDALATGLPFYHGRALFCDATIRSPLARTGVPHPRSAAVDGATFKKAQQDKQRKYHDVASSPHAELLTLAVETGGRWNDTALELVSLLAKHKVLETPEVLRRSAQLAWANRWWTMLAVATQDALAASVLAPASKGLVLDSSASDAPDLDILLDHHRCEG